MGSGTHVLWKQRNSQRVHVSRHVERRESSSDLETGHLNLLKPEFLLVLTKKQKIKICVNEVWISLNKKKYKTHLGSYLTIRKKLKQENSEVLHRTCICSIVVLSSWPGKWVILILLYFKNYIKAISIVRLTVGCLDIRK